MNGCNESLELVFLEPHHRNASTPPTEMYSLEATPLQSFHHYFLYSVPVLELLQTILVLPVEEVLLFQQQLQLPTLQLERLQWSH